MKVCTLVTLLLGCVEVHSSLSEKDYKICSGELVCVPSEVSFPTADESSVPPQPSNITRPKFSLYTRGSSTTPQKLNSKEFSALSQVWTNFKVRPTKILIHGYFEIQTLAPWWKEMKDELLKHGDYNVILVDWSGSYLPPVVAPSALVKIVGATVTEFIKALISQTTVTLADLHVIAHGLGTNIAGYAGREIPGVARITGLDPAGLYFEKVELRLRLDDMDAVFVDVIHTDAGGMGTSKDSGHADFYPNLGHDQPGCSDVLVDITKFFEYGSVESVNCDHNRAIRYFTESINNQCQFLAVPCSSEENYSDGQCISCSNLECSPMGFHAKKPAGQHAKYFLKTEDRAPYCQPVSV